MFRLQEHTHTHTQRLGSHTPVFQHFHKVIITRRSLLLPELSDGARQVGGVFQTVVGETVLRVPVIVTALPRQLLQTPAFTPDTCNIPAKLCISSVFYLLL